MNNEYEFFKQFAGVTEEDIAEYKCGGKAKKSCGGSKISKVACGCKMKKKQVGGVVVGKLNPSTKESTLEITKKAISKAKKANTGKTTSWYDNNKNKQPTSSTRIESGKNTLPKKGGNLNSKDVENGGGRYKSQYVDSLIKNNKKPNLA